MRMESRANGTVSGKASRIVTGWSQDSNWAARIRYMKTMERRKANPKFRAVVPISFEVPVTPTWYTGSRFMDLAYLQRASRADCWSYPVCMLALMVTWRRREIRSTSEGPWLSWNRATLSMLTAPSLVEGTAIWLTPSAVVRHSGTARA